MPTLEDQILTTPISAADKLPTAFRLICEESAVATLGQAFVLLDRMRRSDWVEADHNVAERELINIALELCRMLAERLNDLSQLVEHIPDPEPMHPGIDAKSEEWPSPYRSDDDPNEGDA